MSEEARARRTAENYRSDGEEGKRFNTEDTEEKAEDTEKDGEILRPA